MITIRKMLIALWSVVVALSLVLVAASSASADTTPQLVRVITVSTGSSTLTLHLDNGIPASTASKVKQKLQQNVPSAAAVRAADIMFCTTQRSYTDSNGTLHLARFCSLHQLRWDYRISAAVQAIIVSNVHEYGLWYWINGTRQPQNSPHTVPRDYLFHGTMSRVYTGQIVDYQDYMTFRHNVGSGGTGSIFFYGSIQLT